MKHPLSIAIVAALAVLSTPVALAATPAKKETAVSTSASIPQNNPFLKKSTLPFEYPEFDKIKDSDFAPALDYGMAQALKEVDAITKVRSTPTFDNTIVPLEKSGEVLSRATRTLFNLIGTDTNPEREKLRADYAPKLSEFQDKITLNPALFARIKTVYDNRDKANLDPEQKRLVERYYTDYVRDGAALSEKDKARLKEINTELAKLGTQFSQNVLKEVNDSALVVDNKAELAGLTDEQIETAAEAAKKRGLEGKYLITLLNTTGQPPESQLTNRALRERLHKASIARNSRGNEFDNRELISRVVKLRTERAKMLGYENYAAYVLEDATAKNTKAVNDMLGQLAPAAVANARKEGAELQAMIDKEQKAKGEKSFTLEPWDWAFYSEKVRSDKYNFDESQLKPYLEMRNVLENGVFYAAEKLYGITFKERKDLPKYHPDTITYDVIDKDGSPLAIFIFDPYARESKRGGAWMNSYVSQSKLLNQKPVIANHLNIPKPTQGKPTLLTWDEVTTTFHEFGHALHGMFSNVTYPYFSGTSVPRDFVEFPSQVNEMWADWPEILANYAKHYQTGAPMPKELLDKVQASKKFNQGFATTEYLGSAMLDQSLHQLPENQIPAAADMLKFEADALKKDGLDYAAVPPRYRIPYFSHIMGGYGAGYYAYIWSEVLDANTVDWIKKNGGLKRENGDRFRDKLLSRGGTKEASELFTDFVGHEPDIKPLLIKRGLTEV